MNSLQRNHKLNFLEGEPKICVPIVGKTILELLEEARVAQQSNCDLIEWRVDYYQAAENKEVVVKTLEDLKLLVKKPILVTFRTVMEGGTAWFGEEAYHSLMREVIHSELADYIDLELFLGDELIGELCQYAHKHGVQVVISNHDFKKTPPKQELVNRIQKMHDLGADLPKIAVMPQNEMDVLKLMCATRECIDELHITPIITMAMGQLGMITRIHGKLFGSAMTFATTGQASAPGQLEIEQLQRIWNEI